MCKARAKMAVITDHPSLRVGSMMPNTCLTITD